MLTESDILNASLLIVDDQQSNVLLLTQMLREAGYLHVSSTMNPHLVCELHRDNAYDLILLDLQMPSMDGFVLMEALKANTADPYLSVLVVTAQPDHKLRALQAGAKDFVSKPFDFAEVKTRIRNLLEVRLLYKRLHKASVHLNRLVEQRTAELQESEARYRSLTELAVDWYWEQDEQGKFTKVSGPVLEMLGIRVEAFDVEQSTTEPDGWNATQRKALQTAIAAREAFLDFSFDRIRPDGSTETFLVSGEPMFDRSCRFIGYRGVGVEVGARHKSHRP